MNGPRIRDALQFATQRLKNARIASARLEATAFVAESLGLTHTDLILQAETSLDAHQEERINDLVTRRDRKSVV